MDVPRTFQVVAVASLALLGELALGEREGHVQEQRQVRPRNGVVAEFQVENPPPQARALLPCLQLGTLETDVGIDVTVEQHDFPVVQPPAEHRRGAGPIAREEQCDHIGIDPLHRPQFAPQEAGDQLPVNGGVETGEMEEFARHAPRGEQPLQHPDLGRFPRTVQTFQYDKHGFFSGFPI